MGYVALQSRRFHPPGRAFTGDRAGQALHVGTLAHSKPRLPPPDEALQLGSGGRMRPDRKRHSAAQDQLRPGHLPLPNGQEALRIAVDWFDSLFTRQGDNAFAPDIATCSSCFSRAWLATTGEGLQQQVWRKPRCGQHQYGGAPSKENPGR